MRLAEQPLRPGRGAALLKGVDVDGAGPALWLKSVRRRGSAHALASASLIAYFVCAWLAIMCRVFRDASGLLRG